MNQSDSLYDGRRRLAFTGPWTENEMLDVLHFAADLTGEVVEDFITIGAVLEPDEEEDKCLPYPNPNGR